MKKLAIIAALISFLAPSVKANEDLKEFYPGTNTLHVYCFGSDNAWYCKEFSKEGALLSDYSKLNHEKDGYYLTYHPNGQIKSVIHSKNHKLNGVAQQFDENGTIDNQAIYQNGQVINQQNYHYPQNVPVIVPIPIGDGSSALDTYIQGHQMYNSFQQFAPTSRFNPFYQYK